MFHEILENLRTNYWSPDGNWQGDWMYDASALAPKALYRFGMNAGDADLVQKANITIERNLDLIVELITGGSTNPLEALMALPSGLEAVEFYSGDRYRDFPLELLGWVSLGLSKGLIEQDPNPLGNYVGYVFGLGTYAYSAMELGRIVRGLPGLTAAAWGLDTLDVANTRYWVEESYGGVEYGYYWDDDPQHPFNQRMSSFVNGPMLLALAMAYGVTRDEGYRSLADALVTGINSRLWDEDRGGYAAHLDLLDAKDLSGNNAYIIALLELYNVTGEMAYLDRARETLDFIERDLFIPDRDHPGYFICSHDWREGSGTNPDFCTGCNFAQLYSIYRLNELVQNGPVHPNPVPVCGQLPGHQRSAADRVLHAAMLMLPLLAILQLRRNLRQKWDRSLDRIAA
jgi:hypothetical protein